MLGIVYIALCLWSGKRIMERFAPGLLQSENIPAVFSVLPASYLVGTLLLSWGVYLCAWLVSLLARPRHPLFAANAIVLPVAALCCIAGSLTRLKKEPFSKPACKLSAINRRRFLICFIPSLLLVSFLTFMTYRSFSLRGGNIYIGYSVFSDFATHLGMLRSFSYGNNFPTQYSHFGGQDIRYHFMFQFLAGNLEYLGLPLDHAFNLPSILSMASACSLLFVYAVRLCKRPAAGAISVLFMLFHPSLSLPRALSELPAGGFVWSEWLLRTGFFSYTDKEDWGLWNYKLYLNQRHLAFGLGMVFLILLLTDRAEDETSLRKQLRRGAFFGVLLGLSAFWNGAMVIGALCVLFVLALASDQKPMYAMLAAISILLSLLQSRFFVFGDVLSPSFYYGFLAGNKSVLGCVAYLLSLSGLLLILAAFCFAFQKVWRLRLLAFSMPLLLAFFVSLTPDITVNHKYVQLSFLLLGIAVADLLCGLWKKGRAGVVFLLVLLCTTGMYECLIVYNIDREAFCFSEDDPLTRWVQENSTSGDLWLSDRYSNHASVLGGAMLYYGWPYYAWSAGYDTYGREALVRAMFSESDPQRMRELMREENIRFILIDDGLRYGGVYELREDVIAANYPCVFAYQDVAVYDTEGSL